MEVFWSCTAALRHGWQNVAIEEDNVGPHFHIAEDLFCKITITPVKGDLIPEELTYHKGYFWFAGSDREDKREAGRRAQ